MLEHLFQAVESGFALHEILYDDAGTPVDYRFLEVNTAFEKLTGLRAAEMIGHRASEVFAGIESARIPLYGHIVQMDEPVHFEMYWSPLRRHFEIMAFCPQPGQFAVLLQDISARKRVEQAEREQWQLAEALRDTAILLNSTLQLEQVIERILDNVGRVLPHDAANISLIENGEIRFVGSHGYGDAGGSFFSAHKHFPLSHFYS